MACAAREVMCQAHCHGIYYALQNIARTLLGGDKDERISTSNAINNHFTFFY